MVLVLLLAVTAAAAAGGYYQHERQSARHGALSTLRAVASARADEIERWSDARLRELRVHASGILRIYVQAGLGLPGDLAENASLLAELRNTQETEGYLNLMVASPEGRLLLSADATAVDLDAEARRTVAGVVASGAAAHGEIFRCSACDKLVVDDAVPIHDEQGRTVAVLIQRTAPEDELLPLLRSWPVPGSSIATVLARRDGDSVLFLNAARPTDPSPTPRWPLSRTDLPAVQATQGRAGSFEGRDERGVEVLAETVAIAGTPWVVVATLDAAEVYAEAGAESRLILALVVLAMLLVGAMGELAHRIRRQVMSDRMQASEAFNRTIVESIPQRLFLKDRDSVYLVVNQAYASTLGLAPDQMIGKDDLAFFPPELAEKYRADDREVMSSGQMKDLEENYQAGGKASVIHTVKVPIRDAEGHVFAVLGLFEDITDRKLAELLLRARVTLHEFERGRSLGELLQKTLDEAEALTGSTIGFYHFLDADQVTLTLQAWSTRTEATFCKAEGRGSHYPIDQAGVWVDCVRERRPVIHNDYASLPHRRGLPEGHAPLVRELVVPILRDDRIVAILGVGNKPADYTDLDVRTVSFLADVAWEIALHKRSEEALRGAEEARVRLEASARQKQKLEGIGTLASGVAHEINNPLNVILNYGQLLVDAPDDPAVVRDFAGNIVKESGRVASIVRNLLSFARQDKESHSPALVSDIVEQTLSLMHTQFRKDRIAVTCELPHDLPAIRCRTQQIQQVLMNLLTNARDALDQKYPGAADDKAIRISAAPFEREGRPWVRVSVEDHGAGIPPEVAERIFDPFFTTKPRDRGTGLGLSISYGILREHHGELRFETRLGVGTTFHVELPAAEKT